jgi:hypothetical protein
MALDLTTFVEVDPGGDITVTAPKVHFSGQIRNDTDAYVYSDFGTGYFTDFSFDFECKIDNVSGNNGLVLFAGISNTIGSRYDMEVADDGIVFGALANYGTLTFFLGDYAENNQDNYYYGGYRSNLIYCTFTRLGTIASVKIYADSGRTALIDTVSITCETNPKQYLYAFASADDTGSPDSEMGGFSQNFVNDTFFGSNANIQSDTTSKIVGPNYFDLTTFTEVDSGGDITVTHPRAAFDTMQVDAVSYLYKDMGVDHFTNFSMDFEVKIDGHVGNTGYVTVFAISNTIGTIDDRNTAQDSIELNLYAYSGSLRFDLYDRSSENVDQFVFGGSDTPVLHCHFQRVGDIALVRFYSDYAHTVLLDTISVTCETDPKQYLYALSSEGLASSDSLSGYVQYFERDFKFVSKPGIHNRLVSDIYMGFSGNVNILSDISSSINIERDFVSQADIASNITDADIHLGNLFASQADIGSDITDPVIYAENLFISQADITYDMSSHLTRMYFLSQADIVHDITDPDISAVRNFISQADIVSDISDPDYGTQWGYVFNPEIIFDIVSRAGDNKEFSSTAGMAFDTDSDIEKSNIITVQADIVHDFSSGLSRKREFLFSADIGLSISSDSNQSMWMMSELGIAVGLSSDIIQIRNFAVAPSIVSSINNIGHQVEKRFRSVPFVMIEVRMATWPGGLYQRMSFPSSPFVMVWTSSAINQPMNFVSQANVVSGISSDADARREFALASGINWDAISKMGTGAVLTSSPAIEFVTVSDTFTINNFGCLPEIGFDLTANTFNERRFTALPQIEYDISDLFHIYVTRNFVSTVNIIINVESLNILNMSIDDLFPNKMRSITPKQTVLIV